jgi:undecaprenyl-diphosphatase
VKTGTSFQNKHPSEGLKNRTSFYPDFWKVLISANSTVLACLFLYLYGDRPIAKTEHHLPHACLAFFSWITVLGNSAAYLIVFGLAFLLLLAASKMDRWKPLRRKLRRIAWIALFLFLAVAISGIIVDMLKVIFARYRPIMLFESGKYGFNFFQMAQARKLSFPSGHTDTIFAFTTALTLLAPRYRVAFFCIACLVAISRVIIGAHYPSDVIMGAYLGIVTTLYLKGLFLSRGIRIFTRPSVEGKEGAQVHSHEAT